MASFISNRRTQLGMSPTERKCSLALPFSLLPLRAETKSRSQSRHQRMVNKRYHDGQRIIPVRKGGEMRPPTQGRANSETLAGERERVYTVEEVFTGKKHNNKNIPPSIISRSGREPRPELYLTEIFCEGYSSLPFYSNHLLTKAGTRRKKTVKVVLRNPCLLFLMA